MEYKLISPRRQGYSAIEQVLANRGIEDINHYLNTSDNDILNPMLLDNMEQGAKMLISHIAQNDRVHIIIDSDVDGYTSSAILLNYLNMLFPHFVQTKVSYSLHKGKEHGIILEEVPTEIKLLIVPDAGSSDLEQQKLLLAQGIETLVLDHHHSDSISEYACVINNQLCDYPTKSLSGAGIAYKFCSYLDSLLERNCAEKLLDLVALGLVADVMSLADYETKRLIEKGLKNIENPYFKGMTIKNAYQLGNQVTPFGVAFYIAPYVNAVVRMGTMEEKLILFESMLDFKAYEEIPSTKRGCKGQMETVVEQACRNCANVKNRQTKQRDTSLELIERIIEEQNLLENKILLVQLKAEDRTTLTGLIANVLMSKYQRPILILSETKHEPNEIWYEGSGRAPTSTGDFRQVCEDSKLVEFAQGHPQAFGLSIKADNIPTFISYMNNFFKDFDFSPKYDVDFIINAKRIEENKYDFYNIMDYSALWGQQVEQPLFVIEDLNITKDSMTVMKGPTLKFTMPGNSDISIIKFKATEEEVELLTPSDSGCVKINVVGVCERNSFDDKPQIIVKDFEIIERQQYYF